MPARAPVLAPDADAKLIAFGEQIRSRRKALKINATVAAEAAGMSRVTLHRIERGEPAVTIGAYLNLMLALGMDFSLIGEPTPLVPRGADDHAGWIPARIRLADYPQLRQLAWQLHGVDDLSPVEALGIYERNWRHVDLEALQESERQLVEALRTGLAGSASRV